MKKSILTLALGTFLSLSFAQPKQGNYVIGGSTGFNFSKNPSTLSNNYSSSFSLTPRIGRFLTDNMLLDGGIGYSLNHNRNNDGITLTRTTSHAITGSIGLTKYFPLVDKLYFNVGAFLSSSYGPTKTYWEAGATSWFSDSYTVSGSIGLTPGFSFFFNEKWMMYANLGSLAYDLVYYSPSDLVGHSVGYNFSSNSFGLGARFMFGSGS